MDAIRMNSLRKSPIPSPAVARNLERIAWLMDRAIKVPGTNISVGLDALLGLFPIGGDVLTGFVQAGLVLVALYHYRVPKVVAMRMMGNVLIDVAVGAIPLVGDLFDVAFKANTRNLRLLEPYRQNLVSGDVNATTRLEGASSSRGVARSVVAATGRSGMPWRFLVAIAAVLVTALILVVIGLGHGDPLAAVNRFAPPVASD